MPQERETILMPNPPNLINLIERPNKDQQIKELIDAGADVNESTKGSLPLIVALSYNKLSIARMLLDAGADARKWDEFGKTALHVVQDLEFAKELIARGASVSAAVYRGETPLHAAAREGYLPIVKLLLEHGANPNAQARVDITPLFCAIGNIAVSKALLAAGADVNACCDTNNISVLMGSVGEDGGKKQLKYVQFLVDAGADLAHRSADEDTILMWVVRTHGTVNTARLLIEAGADVNACNADGETPLSRAVYDKQLDFVRCFLAAGANPVAPISSLAYDRARSGKTPVDLAVDSGDPELIDLLNKAAAAWSDADFARVLNCRIGMNELEKAECYLRRRTEFYPENAFEWFLWCKQTGQGDIETARRLMTAHCRSAVARDKLGPYVMGLFQELCGDPDAALQIWTAAFDRSSDPGGGVYAALLAHELGKTDQRDRLLGDIATRGSNYRENYRPLKGLISLAAMIQQAIAAGRPDALDESQFAKIVEDTSAGEAAWLHYFAGRFLLHEGQTEKGRQHLVQSASSTNTKLIAAMAAVVLREQ